MFVFRPSVFLLLALLLGLAGACTHKTVSFNSRAEEPNLLAGGTDSLTTASDTARAPSLLTKRVAMTKAEEKAAKEKEKAAKRKPKKKKNVFLGQPIKKGYAKSGPKGKKQIIETFYYLKTFQEPDAYAPGRYYYDSRKHHIYKATGELDPKTSLVLHGPYKKMQGGKVVETGYFNVGTRHLRWEQLTPDNILRDKVHYEKGFPRDAVITYYDTDHKKLKEVVPYVNGDLEGDYVRYLENGRRDWDGQFENGKRVGEWVNYWGFRSVKDRRHYVYAYGESGYDPEVAEPELVQEYNRNGVLIFDKEKGYDKRGSADASATPGDTRRPGYHPKPGARKK